MRSHAMSIRYARMHKSAFGDLFSALNQSALEDQLQIPSTQNVSTERIPTMQRQAKFHAYPCPKYLTYTVLLSGSERDS